MGIYFIRNTATCRVYVGCTDNIRRRVATHKRELAKGSHRNSRLQRSYHEHGTDSFEYGVLELVAIPDALVLREQHWIDHFGGPDGPGVFNLVMQAERRTHSPETRAKMSRSHAGRTFTAEHKANLSASLTGRAGKPLTAEQRANLSARMKGKRQSPESVAKRVAAQKGRARKPNSP